VSTAGESLRATLEHARTLGFLGPGDVDAHLRHAAGFVAPVVGQLGRAPVSMLDLGSGSGIPGLVLAQRWPDARIVLVESGHRRSDHLRAAVAALGYDGRVQVVEERAELTAHRPEFREQFEVVTARSFATPAATAEIAAGLVAVGGLLVVSEPPHPDPARWPPDGLDPLGFGPPRSERGGDARDAHFVVFVKTQSAPSAVPRAVGRPGKRPRW
jgi:16S rRNA (guanine527-N7)-methyltransferase